MVYKTLNIRIFKKKLLDKITKKIFKLSLEKYLY